MKTKMFENFCTDKLSRLKGLASPVNALRAQNLAGDHFLSHEIRLVFVSLSI